MEKKKGKRDVKKIVGIVPKNICIFVVIILGNTIS
jgi:hypothetical protein